MVTGYPSDATKDAVQANIVTAKYGTTTTTSGRAIIAGSSISLVLTSSVDSARTRRSVDDSIRLLSHTGSGIHTKLVSSTSSTSHMQSATWIVHTGLGNNACYSLEASNAR